MHGESLMKIISSSSSSIVCNTVKVSSIQVALTKYFLTARNDLLNNADERVFNNTVYQNQAPDIIN